MKQIIEVPTELSSLFEGCSSCVEVRERCYRILNDQPGFHKVRVLLSKLYYLEGHLDFAVRELQQIKNTGDYPIINRILKTLGVSSGDLGSGIVAEVSLK